MPPLIDRAARVAGSRGHDQFAVAGLDQHAAAAADNRGSDGQQGLGDAEAVRRIDSDVERAVAAAGGIAVDRAAAGNGGIAAALGIEKQQTACGEVDVIGGQGDRLVEGAAVGLVVDPQHIGGNGRSHRQACGVVVAGVHGAAQAGGGGSELGVSGHAIAAGGGDDAARADASEVGADRGPTADQVAGRAAGLDGRAAAGVDGEDVERAEIGVADGAERERGRAARTARKEVERRLWPAPIVVPLTTGAATTALELALRTNSAEDSPRLPAGLSLATFKAAVL